MPWREAFQRPQAIGMKSNEEKSQRYCPRVQRGGIFGPMSGKRGHPDIYGHGNPVD